MNAGFTVVEAVVGIDLATAGCLGEHLDAATAIDRPDVPVDLRQLSFLGSGGCAWPPTGRACTGCCALRPVAPIPTAPPAPGFPEKA
ncbi:hypothetical protein ACWGJ6_19480 [Streptomyces canus]|uniref:hypothetical protein n=1 Tax=Streptomyces canus TaxID=58343 RepID=UPI002E26FC2B